MLFAQLTFVDAYITKYHDRHFQWHKGINKKSCQPGYLAVHCAVHYYVMHRDLVKLKGDWKERTSFNEFKNMYLENSGVSINDLANEFFDIAIDRMEKHMDQWRTQNLPLLLGGNVFPATYVAAWLLVKEPPPLSFTTIRVKKTSHDNTRPGMRCLSKCQKHS